jgi:ketosteroid isomerase-like protein
MPKLVYVLLVLLAASRLGAQSGAQPDSEEARILSLENAWNQAVQQKDAPALKMLLASDLIYVEYDGTLMSKAEYLTSVRSPSVRPVRIVNESMTVHLYGAVAVVSGVCRESGVKNGKHYALRERFTDTWIRRSDTWVCVASQSTLVGP